MIAKHACQLSELRSFLGWVVLGQVVLLMVSALLLDGGRCSGLCGSAMVGYWLMIGWLALRRRNELTKADTLLIRSGFLLWLVITLVLRAAFEYF
jgi:hypothetical protein